MTSPSEDDYEAADSAQKISIAVSDEVGDPTDLSLYYWVEADHDLNRNGEADPSEYAHKIVTNNTDADYKCFPQPLTIQEIQTWEGFPITGTVETMQVILFTTAQ